MTISRRRDDTSRTPGYFCVNKAHGAVPCEGHEYRQELADAAILHQVRRLRFLRWDLSRAQETPPTDDDPRPALQRGLEQAREAMKRHVRRFSMLEEDPSEEVIRAHREVGKELSDKIASLEAAIKQLPDAPPSVLDVQSLHEQFSKVPLSELIDDLVAQNVQTELRDIVVAFVDEAVVTERIPTRRSRWLRVSVKWSQAVQALIDAQQVVVGDDVTPPDYEAARREAHALAMQRYNAKRRAAAKS